MLDVYGVTDERQPKELLTLAREGRQRGWWQPYRKMLSETYTTYIGLPTDEADRDAVYVDNIAGEPYVEETMTWRSGMAHDHEVDGLHAVSDACRFPHQR